MLVLGQFISLFAESIDYNSHALEDILLVFFQELLVLHAIGQRFINDVQSIGSLCLEFFIVGLQDVLVNDSALEPSLGLFVRFLSRKTFVVDAFLDRLHCPFIIAISILDNGILVIFVLAYHHVSGEQDGQQNH